ncbi:hypothetical protein SteCoe_23476 [Stentor coeruleus]|uniref:Uncharacterized protein n=1 Tax=Stentor coeruleus TaxID=5963 RepID=A0A1R2BJU4_9CILI|nr:hypothetical protein SteCoe_23476 [Stentor coeruleus]
METSEKTYERSCFLRVIFIIIAILALVLAGFNIRVLSHTDEECDTPIREWIAVAAAVLMIGALPVIIVESCLSKCLSGPRGMKCYKYYNLGLGIFLGFWSPIGLFLLTRDDECPYDFEEGYDLTLFTCGVFFLFLTLAVVVYAIANSCGWLESDKKGYEQVE